MAYDDNARKLAVKVIGTVESDLNYSAINYADPITVGIMQWYGTRAAGILRRMKTENPSAWYGVEPTINNQLDIIDPSDPWWNNRRLTQAEGESLRGSLSRNQDIQNLQASEDLEVYKDVAISYGFDPETNTQTVIFFFTMHHQGPQYALEVVQTLDTTATLDQIHAATLAHPVLGQYGHRYNSARDLILAGDVSGVDPIPAPVPDPTQPNGNARFIRTAGDILLVKFTDGEDVQFYPNGRGYWTPRKALDAPPPPTPEQPAPPPVNAGNGAWTHPLPGSILTSPYGPRSFDGYHWGADLATPGAGGQVYACTDLVITQAYNAGGGNASAGGCVKGHTPDGRYTFCHYHMDYGTVAVSVGQTVPVGTVLGVEGATGNVTGRHLHFEAYEGVHNDPWPPPWGSPVEPLSILRAHGVSI